ncbi:hypothetical protein ACHAXA_007827 [Cyclostephanos tholiformis]|uniref:Uncharacterized protein n=1 Tax=Cyclostephanos tholiformis TaxID=382380 RepID=A0ABD3SBY1_9STRA
MLVELSASRRGSGNDSVNGGGRSVRGLFSDEYVDYGSGWRRAPPPSRTWMGVLLLFLLSLGGVYYLGVKSGGGHDGDGGGGVGGGGDDEGPDDANATASSYKVFPAFGGKKSAREDENSTSTATATATATATTTKAANDGVAKGGTFTIERLRATRIEAEGILSLLEEYYSGKDRAHAMLMTAWSRTWDFETSAEPEERLRASKLIDTMARALVTDEQGTFLMGGIGSSVMAGHDNCHYDSYQAQMERLWQPVWAAAGMDFVFQNAGEGGGCGDSHKNQHFCVKVNISPNVDIIHYSWTYFENGGGYVEHENLIRWAQMLPKQPIVHILLAGDEDPAGDPNHPDNQLVSYYATYGHNIVSLRHVLRRGGHDYDSEINREVDPFDRFGWGYLGDGYHNTTRYGEQEEEVRKNSLGVVMRNWHPGPLGFQAASDAFTYVYTRALLKALDLIEEDMNIGKDPRDTWSASRRRVVLKGDLPEPKYCDPEYCVVNEPPECLNFELPTFGKWGARTEAPDGELNPYKGQLQNWSIWHAANDLWFMVAGEDVAFFQNRDDKEICRHLDTCGGITAQTVNDGMVVFRLPKMSLGLVIICGKQDGWENGAQGMFINNTNIEISFNTVPLDQNKMDVFPNGKCVRVLKRFPTSGRESQTPTGHHYLAVKVLNDMERRVLISHVITL